MEQLADQITLPAESEDAGLAHVPLQLASALGKGLQEALIGFTRVLSNEPGMFQAKDKLSRFLCLRTDADGHNGVLLVSQDYQDDHEFLQYRERIKHGKVKFKVQVATLDEIAAAASNEAVAAGHRLEAAQQRMLDLLRVAQSMGASDLHIQVKKKLTIVRVRAQGDVITIARLTAEDGMELLSALYATMCDEQESSYDIRKDQGATLRSQFAQAAGMSNARVATRPSIGRGGMRFTIRLITDYANKTMAEIGYDEDEHVPQIDYMLERAFGFVLITGVTGSGKSMTFAVALRQLSKMSNGSINIMTIEDPTEGEIDDEAICQTPLIYDRSDPTAKDRAWPLGISSLLRHDPDVIAPQEIRDSLSAKGAAEAVLSGHLCLSTLHVTEAVGVPERLLDLGVSPSIVFNAAYQNGYVNQSLVPYLCKHCKVHVEVVGAGGFRPAQYKRLLDVFDGDLTGVYVRGSSPTCECGGKGAGGRTLVAEVLTPTPKFFAVYRSDGMEAAKKYAVQTMGFMTKLQHALKRIRNGEMDPRDVEEVLGPLDLEMLTLGDGA